MTEIESFLKSNYRRVFGYDWGIEVALNQASEYLLSQGYEISDDERERISYSKPNDLGNLVVFLNSGNASSALLSLGLVDIVFQDGKNYINFATGEMRIPTNKGYVLLPNYNYGRILYYPKGTVAFIEAILSRPFNAKVVEASEILSLMGHIDPEERIALNRNPDHKEALRTVFEYANKKSKDELASIKTSLDI